jgi:DNA-directed RNA polymerase subunit D
MQFKLIQKNQDKTKYHFLIKGVEPYFINAIRRSAVSLVPTMAIEHVEFRKNSSILYDEIIAHRLGLVPLKTDLKSYDMIKKPEDVESLKCINKLTLKVKGPKTAYSGDFKASDPAIVPVYDNIPIVSLNKGQELEIEVTAILGIGKEHTKWSPGIVYYKNKPIITIKSSVDVDKLKKNIPEDSALKITGNKVSVDENKLYTTNYFDAFVGESIIEGVDVTASEDEFILVMESFGQLSVKEMMTTSLDVIKEKLNELSEKIMEN